MPEFEHKRSHRVSQLVQEELGRLLVEGVKDPRVGFVTVTEVRLTNDLRSCHVFVSMLGNDEARTKSLTGLRAAAGFLRRELGKRLQLRYCPELTFMHDDSLDNAQRLETLFLAAARGEHEVPAPLLPDALPAVEIARVPLPSVPMPELKRPPVKRSQKNNRTSRTSRISRNKRKTSK